MANELNIPIECSVTGCNVVRRSVNHWYVVVKTKRGVEIIRWDDCPSDLMKTGSRVCGLDHAFRTASKLLTPDNTDANRESTLVLAPPLTRDGEHIPPPAPVAVEEIETKDEQQ
jgi:hypothetical protein